MDNTQNRWTNDKRYEQLVAPLETEPQVYHTIQAVLRVIDDPAFSHYVNERQVATANGRVVSRQKLLLSVFDGQRRSMSSGRKITISRDTDVADGIEKTVLGVREGKYGIQQGTGSLLMADNADFANAGRYNFELNWRIPNQIEIQTISRMLYMHGDAYAAPLVELLPKTWLGRRIGRLVMGGVAAISDRPSSSDGLPMIQLSH